MWAFYAEAFANTKAIATQVWRAMHKKQKPQHFCWGSQSSIHLRRGFGGQVVWAGIEPATQGFSVLCSTD